MSDGPILTNALALVNSLTGSAASSLDLARLRSHDHVVTSEPLHRRAHGGDRLRYLTDAVFAIVMTLLVLELPTPAGNAVGRAIVHALPKIAVYLLTVAVLGGMWFRNRTESEYVARANHALSWLTFAWLAVVALLPWSASVMMEHPRSTPAVATFTINAMLAAAVQRARGGTRRVRMD